MGLYEKLKALEPFSLSCHHDADGIYSATLLRRIFNIKKDEEGEDIIEIPEFGTYTTDVAVDLGFPEDTSWSGICIDHHPDHPEDRKYKLYWDYCPTGLILYNHLKEHIKPEDYWLVVGSLAGDGQPDLTPDAIWDSCPELLGGRGILYKSQWKLGISSTPLYRFLSSGVNSLCRQGFPETALEVLEHTTNPVDLLENDIVVDAVDEMRKEEDAIYKTKPVVESLGNFALIRIKPSKPQINLHGLIASRLMGNDNKITYIVLNTESGKGSIRGDLAKYMSNKLLAKGFKAGGHSAYCGVKVAENEVEKLVDTIRKIAIGLIK